MSIYRGLQLQFPLVGSLIEMYQEKKMIGNSSVSKPSLRLFGMQIYFGGDSS
jgi:hypothetical protein